MNPTIIKHYENLKGAHRQWRHPGHCSKVHGENWAVDIEIGCTALDTMNFVLDFGKLREIRGFLDDLFDHTLLIDVDDPAIATFLQMERDGLCRLKVVPSASAEGLARYILDRTQEILNAHPEAHLRGLAVWTVTVYEDSKNKAILRA